LGGRVRGAPTRTRPLRASRIFHTKYDVLVLPVKRPTTSA
jgi:hypothetical protein